MAMVPLGEWLPDQPEGVPSAREARNVIAGAIGYRSLPSLAPASDPLPEPINQLFAASDTSLTATVLAATNSRLYKLNVNQWTDLTRTTGPYATVGDQDAWRGIVWGNRVLLTNYRDPIQYHTLGTDAPFQPLGGDPPKARHIAAIRDFVVLAGTDDPIDGEVPWRVRWSGLADSESWDISPATQADFQDIQDAGEIRALIGGEYGIIICDRAIYRMTYVGSPIVWQFDRLESDRGTFAPDSVVALGGAIFYLGHDGFYLFDGQQSKPIGSEKVDKYFFDRLNHAYARNIRAAVDPARGIVMWAFPTLGSAGGALSAALIYNFRVNKWSYAEFPCQTLARTLTTGYTLEQLDQISTSVETLPASLDSPLWTGGKQMFSGGTPDNRLGHFTGPPLPALVETEERQLGGERRAWVSACRPQVEGTAVTTAVSVGERRTMAAPITWSPSVVTNETGQTPLRSNNRYHRFAINITGVWDEVTGIDITFRPEGKR